jgi:uncharacterized membrane protein
MLLLEVLGLRRGAEKPEYYKDVRLGLLLMLATLFGITGLSRRQPTPGWLTIGALSVFVAAACLFLASNKRGVLVGLFAFVALRGVIGFLFYHSYSALALALGCIVLVLILRLWERRSNSSPT